MTDYISYVLRANINIRTYLQIQRLCYYWLNTFDCKDTWNHSMTVIKEILENSWLKSWFFKRKLKTPKRKITCISHTKIWPKNPNCMWNLTLCSCGFQQPLTPIAGVMPGKVFPEVAPNTRTLLISLRYEWSKDWMTKYDRY